MDINIDLFDEGTGIEQMLVNHKALWHKYCRDHLSNTKLNRAKKRMLAESQWMKLVALLSRDDLVLKQLVLMITAFSVSNLATNQLFIKLKFTLRWTKRLETVLFS